MSMDGKRIVAAILQAHKDKDLDTVRALLHPDVRVVEAQSLPYGGTVTGIEGFHELVRRVFTTWRNTRVTVERMIAEDDCVVVLATMSGESRACGTPFTMPIAEVWRVVEGKVVEIRPFYFDTKHLCDLYEGDV